MVTRGLPAAEAAAGQERALRALLALYGAEHGLYREILALSRRQGELIRAGAPVAELHAVLEGKRDRLDEIARLERENADARDAWEQGRHVWRGGAVATLHEALREIGTLIEEILELEARNDRLLLAETGA